MLRAHLSVGYGEARQQAGRCVSYLFNDDGSLVLKARLPAEIGMLFLKAHDAAVEEISTARVPAGILPVNRCSQDADADERPSRSALRADALAVPAESFLAHGGRELNARDQGCRFPGYSICAGGSACSVSPGDAGQRAQPRSLAAALLGEAPFAKPFSRLACLAARSQQLPASPGYPSSGVNSPWQDRVTTLRPCHSRRRKKHPRA